MNAFITRHNKTSLKRLNPKTTQNKNNQDSSRLDWFQYALVNQLLKTLVNLGLHHKSLRVDFVVDIYPDGGIKDLERSKRANDGVSVIRIYGADQRLPKQWKKLFIYGKNKEALAQFLLHHLCIHDAVTMKLRG